MTSTLIALFALMLGAEAALAQSTSTPFSTGAPADTVVIASFKLYDGAIGVVGQAVTLNHRLAGTLVPSHFRVSKFVDFRDATWQAYPGAIPRWSSPSFDGSCSGTAVARLVAYFQVRAPRTALQKATLFAMSNIARDTACVVIGA